MISLNGSRALESVKGETVLESALKQKVNLEHSCKTGQCGVCLATLLDGDVEEVQPQQALTDEHKSNNQFLTCCCTPKTNIVIDAQDLTQLDGIEVKTFPARIDSLERLSSNIIKVELRLPPSSNLKFLEGQYIDVIHDQCRRSYSIASDAKQNQVSLLIKRFENGVMSDYWFNHAKSNDLLRVEGPKGTFFIRDKCSPLLFLATGTGIAPVLAILKALESDEGFKQNTPIDVYWGNRYPEEFVWEPCFEKIHVNLVKVCSKPDANWSGEVGYVQLVALDKESDLQDKSVYACGSNEMIQDAKKILVESGLDAKRFYSDAFVQSF